MRIDAHQHYWKPQRGDYGWLTPDTGVLYRDWLPEQLEPLLHSHGIARTVVVQAAPTVEETRYLLALSEAHSSIAGVVGWIDFESPHFASELERMRLHPRFVGLRPMIQDLPKDWMLREPVVRHMKVLEKERFPLDLQLRPHLLDSAARLMEQVPQLRAVIDHIAKPVYGQAFAEWKAGIERLAAYPGMLCKLSGMVPEQGDTEWSSELWKPYAETIFAAFGPERIMFGSDWPVCLISASYDEVVETAASLLPSGWGAAELAGVWGLNAARFYGLED
ncbi:amidohydrolase family protein [Paenibacillus hodogayensis]|uniref:Amidohydrolase family protein n=1 Tax=Paenibacillus hodogayensis TaxID=279208 RepID=A0ABV5VQ54_9BACL